MNCPKCESNNIIRHIDSDLTEKQDYINQCMNCDCMWVSHWVKIETFVKFIEE